MGNRLGLGSTLLLLGLLIAVVPQFIFPVCDHGAMGHAPMKCYWTARAELGVGALIACGGLLLLLCQERATRQGISLMVMLCAVLAMAFPLWLIGVCDGALMPCRAGALPALVVLSGLTIVMAAINAVYLRKPV